MKTIRQYEVLSFNGGFVDTAGFLGLQGLFTAHDQVTISAPAAGLATSIGISSDIPCEI
jgi:uncharacterized membrane protein YoaK (UPF0700 family)